MKQSLTLEISWQTGNFPKKIITVYSVAQLLRLLRHYSVNLNPELTKAVISYIGRMEEGMCVCKFRSDWG